MLADLGATPERLLKPEMELIGCLLESQVTHDPRVYAQPHRAEVRFYRDNRGLEVEVIAEARDGRRPGVEGKMDHHGVDEGAESLLAWREGINRGCPAPSPENVRLGGEVEQGGPLAATDSHLWAEKYTGTLEDVFQMQERVSQAIVEALQIRLSTPEQSQLRHRPIPDAEGYAHWLKAKQWVGNYTTSGLSEAADRLEAGLRGI